MILKIKDYLLGIPGFLKANIFVLITGLLVVLKLYYFNENFYLTNERLVMLVVSTVITFCFLAPIVFFPKKRIKYATTWNIIFSLLILADTVYIRYFDSLPSIQSIYYADTVFSVVDSVKGLFRYQDLLLVIDIPILVYIFRRFRKGGINFFDVKTGAIYNYTFVGFCLFCLLFLTLFDFRNVKLLTTKGYDNRVTAERYSLGGYHMLDIYRSIQSQLVRLSEKEKQEAISDAEKYITAEPINAKTASAKGKNVIIVQFESLQNFVVNKSVDGQEITPNVNKFLKNSDYFRNHYFELGFGGTADSDFVANTSLYPLRGASTFVQYGQHEYIGLADYLKQAGYSTTAYHGFNRSFWNRNIALKSLGYEKFLGSESYSEFSKINMGVNDEDFLIKTAKLIKEQQQPSLSYTITLTSHFPFGLPLDKRELSLGSSYPDTVANYYQAINYADRAFGAFIDNLKKEGLYDDSLIVVYGDHYANVGDLNNANVQKAVGFEQPLTLQQGTEFKQVPLVIHNPGQKEGTVSNKVSSHLDIMPTILNLLGIKETKPYFGQDLYGNTSPFYSAVLYFGGGFIEGADRVFLDGAISGLENGKCFLINTGVWQKTQPKECSSIVEKRNTELNLVEKLIKFNLLKDVN